MYAANRALNYEDVLSDLKKKITSTVSDRAAVNQCVSTELATYVGHDVLDLNCNIHPINSLAIAFKKLAKEFDIEHDIQSLLLGTESTMIKVIVNTSKMWYKATGDRSGMVVFLEMDCLSFKLLKRCWEPVPCAI